MNITNIDSLNSVVNSYSTTKDKSQNTTDKKNVINFEPSSDYVDFSMDYSNDEVSSVVDNIKNSFDSYSYLTSGFSFKDSVNKYGEILKNINSNTNFDDNTKTQLSKLLDNSFDTYAQKLANKIGNDAALFFNQAYDKENQYKQYQNVELGIKGDQIINSEDFSKNLNNMILSAKSYYKNNIDGTEEGLNKYLQEKYSNTESINNLSFDDYNALSKAMNVLNAPVTDTKKLTPEEYKKRREEQANKAIDELNKDGASSTLINAFEKAVAQNKNASKRVDTYNKLDSGYQDNLKKLAKLKEKYERMLKKIEETKRKMEEDYKKQVEKLKKELYKLYQLKASLNSGVGKDDPLNDLRKQHDDVMKELEKDKVEAEKNINELTVQIKDLSKEYEDFQKNPSVYIDKYLEDEEKNSKH
jgi:Chromosome segregation ATPases